MTNGERLCGALHAGKPGEVVRRELDRVRDRFLAAQRIALAGGMAEAASRAQQASDFVEMCRRLILNPTVAQAEATIPYAEALPY